MIASTLVVAVVGFFLAIVHRAVSILFNYGWFRSGEFGDATVHKLIVRHLRGEGRSEQIPSFVIPNKLSYPLLFHRLAALFPHGFESRFPFALNSIVFALGVSLFSAISWISLNLGGVKNSWEVLLLAFFLFFVASNQNLFFGPAIVYLGFSARLLGRIFTSLLALTVVFGIDSPAGWNLWLTVSVVFAAGAFLSSRFAIQVMVFVFPIQSALLVDLRPLGVVMAGFVLAAIISRGYALRTVSNLFAWWTIYSTRVAKSRFQRPSLSAFTNISSVWTSIANRDPRRLLSEILQKEPLRTVINLPLFFALLILISLEGELNGIGSLAWATTLVWLATSTRALSFVGESYRYIEFTMYFVVPLYVANKFLGTFHQAFWGLVIVFALFSTSHILFVYSKLRHPASTVDSLSDFLDELSLPDESTVFPIPMRLGPEVCLRRPTVRSFWWQPGGITQRNMFDEYIEEYPYLRVDWRPLALKHCVSMVIVDRLQLSASGLDYDLLEQDLLLSSERWAAYRFDCKTA